MKYIKLGALFIFLFSQTIFGQSAYIPNAVDNTVSVISLASNSVIATIPVGTTPEATAVSLDGSTVYIGNTGSNSVSVINTANNTVTSTIPLGFSPNGLCVSPNGQKLYVTNGAGNTVQVINTGTHAVMNTMAVGTNPKGITITPNGKKIYVTNFEGGTISVIDSTTNAVSATILYFAFPYGICMHPNGTKAYATNIGSSVAEINTSTDYFGPTITVPSNTQQVAISPSGTRVASISQTNNAATIIDPNPIYPLYTATVDNGPSGIDLSPDGSRIYVISQFGNFVKVISTLTYGVVATIPVGNNPVAFGKFIASNQATGIHPIEAAAPTFSIYPNPFSESAELAFQHPLEHAQGQVRNILGQVVRTFEFSGSKLIINKNELLPGVYFMEMHSLGQSIGTQRFIISR